MVRRLKFTRREVSLARFLVPLLLMLSFLCACASIPPESVTLSKHVGAGIGESRTAHFATLNAFYEQLKKDNDAWVVGTYLPRAIQNSREALTKACADAGDTAPECSQLDDEAIQQILTHTVRFRDEIQAALEKSRDQATSILDEHYASLGQANAGVTALLASAVDMAAATKDSAARIGKVAGLEIDTDEIQKAVDGFLTKAGSGGAKVSELEEALSAVLGTAEDEE